MGTIIVGGALLIIVALIILNIIRKIHRGGSACCSGSDCACGCVHEAEKHGCCPGSDDCHCHPRKTTVTK